jgi:hypothetical protein
MFSSGWRRVCDYLYGRPEEQVTVDPFGPPAAVFVVEPVCPDDRKQKTAALFPSAAFPSASALFGSSEKSLPLPCSASGKRAASEAVGKPFAAASPGCPPPRLHPHLSKRKASPIPAIVTTCVVPEAAPICVVPEAAPICVVPEAEPVAQTVKSVVAPRRNLTGQAPLAVVAPRFELRSLLPAVSVPSKSRNPLAVVVSAVFPSSQQPPVHTDAPVSKSVCKEEPQVHKTSASIRRPFRWQRGRG